MQLLYKTKTISKSVKLILMTIVLIGGWRNSKDCTAFSIQNSINSSSSSSRGISSSSRSRESSGSSRSSGGSSSSSKPSWKTSSVGLSFRGRGAGGETMVLAGCETFDVDENHIHGHLTFRNSEYCRTKVIPFKE